MRKEVLLSIGIFVLTLISFLTPMVFSGKLPIPADTIVGLYHPYRDLYASTYPNGIPYKNFLLTDPVRQQYPWRYVSIENLKHASFPLWNPYVMAGMPLFANIQSAVLYPFNLIYAIIPFQYSWSLQIILQPLLAGLFLFVYLRNLRIHSLASLLGGLAFAFSGFSIAWLEWNTIGHTILWLPLMLLSIDKLLYSSSKGKSPHREVLDSRMLTRTIVPWLLVLLFSLCSSFFAGHLQSFFYVFLVQAVYFITRWILFGRSKKSLLLLVISYLLFVAITAIQWIPALQLIQYSARDIDLDWTKPGWFIPWQHSVQFIAPDFFGNPATLNYWGEWNYGEFIGYIGVFPFIMAIHALFFRYDRKTLFFGSLFFLSLLFAFPTFFAKLPFLWDIPFLSTAQPTRLLAITDFSLAVLAAFGVDYFINKKKNILVPLLFTTFLFGLAWLFVIVIGKNITLRLEDLETAKRNLYLPSILLIVAGCLLLMYRKLPKKLAFVCILGLIFITSLDLVRFANKFTPFTSQEYLYPSTKTISFLQKQLGYHRIMATDQRILPPNFSLMHKIATIEGYDPLYLRKYGELIAASERGQPNTDAPFGFNRIITPKVYESEFIDLLGVKFVLSLTDISSPKLKKVFQEGQTQIYENTDVLPRTYFVPIIVQATEKDAMKKMFEYIDFSMYAVVEESDSLQGQEFATGKAEIKEYSENRVVIETNISASTPDAKGFLVFTDTYYPTWRVSIDGKEADLYRTNYTFRGVVVPRGQHIVVFYNTLF